MVRWVAVGIVALNATLVLKIAILAASDRQRKQREIRSLETSWHLEEGSSLRAEAPGPTLNPLHRRGGLRVTSNRGRSPLIHLGQARIRPRPSLSRSFERRFVKVAIVALVICAGTAFASPGGRQLVTSALGAVVRALGVGSSPDPASLPPTSPGSDRGAGGDARASDVATTNTEPPSAPTDLTAVPGSSTQIDLNWADVAKHTGFRVERSPDGANGQVTVGTTGQDVTGYRVERSPDGSKGWVKVGTTNQDVTTYSDTGLSPGTTFYYRVSAFNAGGVSPASNVASATTYTDPPSAPTDLSALPESSTEIDLTWADVATDTGYQVERSPDGSNEWDIVGTTDQDVTTYSDTDLSSGTTFYYRVIAINDGGVSPASDVVSATTYTDPPSAPTDLSAVPESSTEIDLTWTDVATDTGYQVERSPDGSNEWDIVGTTDQDVTTYSDIGLSPGTTFYYRVSAFNAGGYSPASDVVSATTYTDPPSAPTGLAATPGSSTQIDLTWTDVATDTGHRVERSPDGSNGVTVRTTGQDVTGYRVQRSPDGSNGWVTVGTTDQDVMTYSDIGLTSGTTFYYRVIAFNAGGDSPASNVASGTTYTDPPSA
jgi:hypothetical protein